MEPNPLKKNTPLQGFELALEIYLILHQIPNVAFTVVQMRNLIRKNYGEEVRLKRIKQICDTLQMRERIIKVKKTHPRSKNPVSAYHGSGKISVLVDSELYNLAKTINEIHL